MFIKKASKTSLRKSGDTGEQLVADYLATQGYKIVATNYQKQYGEIDIIIEKDDVLAFVEVKTRFNPLFDMTELISPSKQRKIVMVGQHYCAYNNIQNKTIRFDVALVSNDGPSDFKINIIENAFGQGW